MAQSMRRVGILIEIENNSIKETSLGVLTAAAGHEIYAVVMSGDVSALKDRLAEFGADHIIDIKGLDDDKISPDYKAKVLAAAINEYGLDAFLGVASAMGQDLLARIAAIVDEPLISDCIEVDIGEKRAVKSHFSGKTFATLKVTGPLFLCTVRPNAIAPFPASSPAAGDVIEFESDLSDAGLMDMVAVKTESKGKQDLIEAPIVISGGRAMKSAENFEMLDACAKRLGGAVGASRAAVDSKYAPHTIQVGQTGKTVSPKLYIACGISGAVQHFAGMKTSRVIVAINEDREAPIFSKCDYGIVGDIFEIVPALTEKL